MEARRIGGSDLIVSVVGLGGNTFGGPRVDTATADAIVTKAIELGVNFIDTAPVYGDSEVILGRVLRGRRDRVVLATKFDLRDVMPGGVEERMRTRCEQSLQRLQTDYIDLYQLHWPRPEIDTDEIASSFESLKKAGMVRATGVSNYSAWRLAEAAVRSRNGPTKIVSNQVHFSLLHRHPERELLDCCRTFGIGLIPYFPLAGGLLTGKYGAGAPAPPNSRGAVSGSIVNRLQTPGTWKVIEELQQFAVNRGTSLGQLAIAWLLHHREVPSVICGVTTPAQVSDNVSAAELKLSDDELVKMGTISASGAEQPAEAY